MTIYLHARDDIPKCSPTFCFYTFFILKFSFKIAQKVAKGDFWTGLFTHYVGKTNKIWHQCFFFNKSKDILWRKFFSIEPWRRISMSLAFKSFHFDSNKNLYSHLNRISSRQQCYHIWQNFTNLAKVYKSLANFWRFIYCLAKCWASFGKFVTFLDTFSLLQLAKYWKIISPSGHTTRQPQLGVIVFILNNIRVKSDKEI